jgi:hypothetical protein
MLGGAIQAPIGRNVDIPTGGLKEITTESGPDSGQNIHRLLQTLARQQFSSPGQLRSVADALIDYRPRNVIGYDQYIHHFHSFPEAKLINGVEKMYSGNGSSKDHPKLHQLFMDSFQHHPELVSLYAGH